MTTTIQFNEHLNRVLTGYPADPDALSGSFVDFLEHASDFRIAPSVSVREQSTVGCTTPGRIAGVLSSPVVLLRNPTSCPRTPQTTIVLLAGLG